MSNDERTRAISELQPHIKSEENSSGLIPVAITEFVKNNEVDHNKLKHVLSEVEASWQTRLTSELNRQSDWQDKLGKRI